MADDDAAVNEDAYDLGSSSAPRRSTALDMPLAAPGPSASSDEPLPTWAQQYKRQQEVVKLKGACVKWAAGKGFIARDDGAPDVYVHQRDIKKDGFRSLALGERLEFEIGRMDDGRVYAIKVTGPGGVDVQGAPRPEKDEGEEDARGAGGPVRTAEEKKASKAVAKASLGFVPRAVKKPAAGGGAKPKPKPAV